jgi:hypothetical protein
MEGLSGRLRGKPVFQPGHALPQVAQFRRKRLNLGAEPTDEFQYQDVAIAAHGGILRHKRVNEYIMPTLVVVR